MRPFRWRWLTCGTGPRGPQETVGWCDICVGSAWRAGLLPDRPSIPGPETGPGPYQLGTVWLPGRLAPATGCHAVCPLCGWGERVRSI